MDLWQALLYGSMSGVIMAMASGFVYMLVRRKMERRQTPLTLSSGQGNSYMEVWQCPRCHRLSTIAHRCSGCHAPMPRVPQLLTVRECEVAGQVAVSAGVIPPDKKQSKGSHHS